MENYQDAIGGLVLMTGLVVIVFIIAKYTYLVKRAMIEKGLVPPASSTGIRYLDIGCIAGGLGAGLLISTIYTSMSLSEDAMDLLVWGTILLCGSAGLMAAHFLRKEKGD